MTKTLADIAAEERAECVGMWADTPGNELAIIASVSEPDVSRVFFPQSRGDGAALLNLFITPRFDLPRAWTPDGEPVEMDVEHEVVQEHPRGGMIGTFENPEYTSFVPGTAVKRWVSDWSPVATPRKINGMVNPYV